MEELLQNQCKKACENLRQGGVHFEVILGGFWHDFGTLWRQVGWPNSVQKTMKQMNSCWTPDERRLGCALAFRDRSKWPSRTPPRANPRLLLVAGGSLLVEYRGRSSKLCKITGAKRQKPNAVVRSRRRAKARWRIHHSQTTYEGRGFGAVLGGSKLEKYF